MWALEGAPGDESQVLLLVWIDAAYTCYLTVFEQKYMQEKAKNGLKALHMWADGACPG